MRRIVITGASGFVGSRLYDFFSGGGKWSWKSENKYEIFAPTHIEMNITNATAVRSYMERVSPDAVIHCAAVSNTWTCQKNPILSRDVNVIGAVNVGLACRKLNSKMIDMSSDQVYNGQVGLAPHREDEQLSPVTIYGKHKLEAEQRILDMGIDVVCLRLAWMFDHPNAGGVQNQTIIRNVLSALKNMEPLVVPIYEYRGITYIRPVVENMEKVLELPRGIYNYGSECSANTYETTAYLFDLIEKSLDKTKLLFPDRERYVAEPRNISMNIEKIKKEGILFPDTIEGLKQCINSSYLIRENRIG